MIGTIFVALALPLVALLIRRRIEASPLYLCLSGLFGGWADTCRGRDFAL
jgi:hypothetical protein